VALINENMRVSCLRWFGHLQRRAINASMRKSVLILVKRTKNGKGRPIIALVKVEKKKKKKKKKRERERETCQLTG
jgi:hypothetical protein